MARKKNDGEDEIRFIVRTYFDQRLERLDKKAQKNAAEILPHMVRAGGQKKAQRVKTLAKVSGISREQVQATIDELQKEPLNLVREVPSGSGSLYELHHDVMAFAVQDWSVRKRQEIREGRQRFHYLLVFIAVVVAASLITAGLWMQSGKRLSEKRRESAEIRAALAEVDKEKERIINYIGVRSDPFDLKGGLLAVIDLYASSEANDVPVFEGILIALSLAADRQRNNSPLFPDEAQRVQTAVWRKIPALRAPGGKYTLVIEANNTPLLLVRDGRVGRSLPPLKAPVVQIGFSEDSERVGVRCKDGSVFVWDTDPDSTTTLKSDTELENALNLRGISKERRDKLLKSAPLPEHRKQHWQKGYTALANEWLLHALSAVTNSHRDFDDNFKLQNNKSKPLTDTLNECVRLAENEELAEDDRLQKALSLLSAELKPMGIDVDEKTLKRVMARSAFYRALDALYDRERGLESDEFKAHERLAIAFDPINKGRIEAQKKIDLANKTAQSGGVAEAIKLYWEAIWLDRQLAKSLDPEAEAARLSPKKLPNPSDTPSQTQLERGPSQLR